MPTVAMCRCSWTSAIGSVSTTWRQSNERRCGDGSPTSTRVAMPELPSPARCRRSAAFSNSASNGRSWLPTRRLGSTPPGHLARFRTRSHPEPSPRRSTPSTVTTRPRSATEHCSSCCIRPACGSRRLPGSRSATSTPTSSRSPARANVNVWYRWGVRQDVPSTGGSPGADPSSPRPAQEGPCSWVYVEVHSISAGSDVFSIDAWPASHTPSGIRLRRTSSRAAQICGRSRSCWATLIWPPPRFTLL